MLVSWRLCRHGLFQQASYHLLVPLLYQVSQFLLCCYIWRLSSHKSPHTRFHQLCICSFWSCTEIFQCKSNTLQVCSSLFYRPFLQKFSVEMTLPLIDRWCSCWKQRIQLVYKAFLQKFSVQMSPNLIDRWYPCLKQSFQLVRRAFPQKFSVERALRLLHRR